MKETGVVKPTAATELTLENYASLVDRPFLALPPSVRQGALALWALHQHLFPSALPITAAIGTWISRYGLKEKAAAEILNSMASPQAMGGFRFAADFMTALAEKAASAIQQRKDKIKYLADNIHRQDQKKKEQQTIEKNRAECEALGIDMQELLKRRRDAWKEEAAREKSKDEDMPEEMRNEVRNKEFREICAAEQREYEEYWKRAESIVNEECT